MATADGGFILCSALFFGFSSNILARLTRVPDSKDWHQVGCLAALSLPCRRGHGWAMHPDKAAVAFAESLLSRDGLLVQLQPPD